MAKRESKGLIPVPPTSNEATMIIRLVDGTRQPIQNARFLIRILDGSQTKLYEKFMKAPLPAYRLPFRDNFLDSCTVLVTGDGYVDAGFSPVQISPSAVAFVDIMLLQDKATFNFPDWSHLKTVDAAAAAFIALNSTEQEAQKHYNALRTTKPTALASLLNLITAMKTIHLPSGTPLNYFKSILWDDSLAQDRFFGYADRALVDQVRRAASEGEFAPEPNPGLFHADATCSFKQIQFGEANVQLTFHEGSTQIIGGLDCVKVEPDIDYYKDLGAHAILEVIPNAITHGLTDPKKVYALRWIAGQHAGVPEFDPPYTISA